METGVSDNDTKLLGQGRFMRLVEWQGWEYAERISISGIVIIVPITDDGKLILVDQYRPPLRARVVEFPAGLIGDVQGLEDEAAQEGARRELLEETGYHAEKLTRLCEGPVSPGSSTEYVTWFLGTGLTKVNDGGGVENEDIRVHAVDRAQLDTWLNDMARSGHLIDVKIYTGLYFLSPDY